MPTTLQPGKLVYERAIFRPLGDRYMTMEMGGEPTVVCNVKVVAMREALKSTRIPGIIGYVMIPRGLTVVYEPLEIGPEKLKAVLREVEQEAQGVEKVRSRFMEIPTWYDDPWTQECARAHNVPHNVDFIAEKNGMTKQQLVERVSNLEYWVSAVFFYIGAYNAFPLDPEGVVSAPKYVIPRTWTPDRTVAYAGTFVGSYALPGPGGYQMLGRTPLNLFELEPKNAIFRETGNSILCRYSDRHVYRSIDEQEYNDIRAQVEAGTYDYPVRHETYNIKRYSEAVLRGDRIRPQDFVEHAW
jgi:urea carboxylase